MKNCNWEIINGFRSPSEYQRFCVWIDAQVQEEIVERLPTSLDKTIYGADEQWFKCLHTGDIWRLVKPDAPFYGVWEPVS